MLNKYSELILLAQNVKKLILKNNPDIKSLGITIISLEEFTKLNTIEYFTPDELLRSKNRLVSLAGRYAAKIAVCRALQNKIPLMQMEILPAQSSQPILTGTTSILKNKNLSISITHEDDLVAAIAVYKGKNDPIAVGIDAARISRLAEIVQNQPRVLSKILTSHEIKSITTPADAALNWTGKEAVSKALGIGIWHGGSLLEIEFANIKNEPKLTLNGNLLQKSLKMGFKKWQTNFILNDEHVISFVLARGRT